MRCQKQPAERAEGQRFTVCGTQLGPGGAPARHMAAVLSLELGRVRRILGEHSVAVLPRAVQHAKVHPGQISLHACVMKSGKILRSLTKNSCSKARCVL